MVGRKDMNREIIERRAVTRQLLKWQSCRCFYCAAVLSRKAATFDHIKLKCEGGEVSLENGVAACSDCNWLRGDMPFDEFCEDLGIVPRHRLAELRLIGS